MAANAQGTTVTWGSTQLGEVVSVSVDGVTAEAVDVTGRTTSRIKVFSPGDTDYGTVSLTVRGSAGMNASNVGLTAALSISSPGASWNFPKAMFERLGWSASVGDLQVYNVTFKIGA